MHADLPHKVIEGDYGTRDVQRRVERIRKIVAEAVRCGRVKHRRALPIAHFFTWLRSEQVSTQSAEYEQDWGSYI